MKKFIALTVLFLTGTVVTAEVNLPEAPISAPYSYNTTKSSTRTFNNEVQKTSSQTTTKAQLDSLAINALKAAEKHNEADMQTYLYEMLEKGVTGLSEPQVIAKQTPNCPPIQMELNGRNLKGSLCTKMGYEFNNREYWVGYCK